MLALGTLALAAACSKSAAPSILGHWRAERVQMFSAQIPVGPEIVVSEKEISSPDTDINMSVQGFDTRSDQVTADLAYGIGLTFYFDGPDRVFLKVPLVGKVYYRRVLDSAASGGGVSSSASVLTQSVERRADGKGGGSTTNAEAIQSMTDSHSGSSQSTEDARVTSGQWVAEYQMASEAAREGRSDAAIDYLNQAFKAGFRDFPQLDSASEFSALSRDVRFQALVARYR